MKKLFCSHDYELIDKFVVKSEFEIINENGYTPTAYNSVVQKHVSDFKCTKCNKLKRKTIRTES